MVIPGSNERELHLLRLGLVSRRGLSVEDTARLSGELPVAEIKLRAAEYIDKCHLVLRRAVGLLRMIRRLRVSAL